MIIRVDIDKTICSGTKDGRYQCAQPYRDRIKIVNQWYEQGHIIIYWTARGQVTGINMSEMTKAQLDGWGCLYHDIQLNKPMYDVLVDDKAGTWETLVKGDGKEMSPEQESE